MNKLIKKPTKTEICDELGRSFGVEVKEEFLTDDVYEKAIKGYKNGISLRTMSGRVRFHLAATKTDSSKEKMNTTGYFVGSRDLVTKNKPLGKNKVQLLSFLKENDDGKLSLFVEPANPTHFKGFKKSVFGQKVTTEIAISEGDYGHFATPGNIDVIDNKVGVDPELIEVMSVEDVYELEDYTNCAVVATISSIWQLRIPVWEADKWDEEEYPLFVNNNPVFQLYMRPDDDDEGPVLRGSLHPTHISSPYIQVEDFEYIFCDGADIEDDINPSISARKVILLGQKRSNSEYNDKSYVDFDINGIIEITGSPLVTSPPVVEKKDIIRTPPGNTVDGGDAKVRQTKVAESVMALKEATTPDVVRTMHEDVYFKGVTDDEIKEMIVLELHNQEIVLPENKGDKDLWG